MLDARGAGGPDRGRADPRRADRPRPVRGAQARGRAARGGRPARAGRGSDDPDARSATARGVGDRALADRPMVCRRRDARRGRRSRRCARATSGSCPRPGRRPGSTGWRISSPGASRASSGGATRSRPGTTTTARSMSPRPRPRRRRRRARASRCAATRTCSTPGSPRRSGRSRTLGWPEQTETLAPPLSERRARSRASTSSSSGMPGWRCMGLHFMGERPWKTLYLHGLVRDAQGQKMSKSKGNTVDPLGLIERYGADALRFTLAAMESQGRDIKLDEKRVEGYRNFATKLWNAARFCQANGIGASATIEPPRGDAAGQPLDRRRDGEDGPGARPRARRAALRRERQRHLPFRLGPFCDWYLELIKPILPRARDLRRVRGEGLRRPAPSPPGCSTRSWSCSTRSCRSSPRNCGARWASGADPLILAHWPMPDARALDPEAGPEIDWLIRLVERRSAPPAPSSTSRPARGSACTSAMPVRGPRQRLERHRARRSSGSRGSRRSAGGGAGGQRRADRARRGDLLSCRSKA